MEEIPIDTELETGLAIAADTVKAASSIVVKEVCELAETLVKKLSRQELYDRIWEISVAGVAKECNIPYSQLMKQVKAANIPIPPSGYWTKVNFGKPVEKTPLNGSADTMVSLYKRGNRLITHEGTSAPAVIKATEATQKTTAKPDALLDEIAKASPVSAAHEAFETYEQYGQTYNRYSREKLYQEVWAKPVTEVSKLYQVSDVAIHKICKSLDIPTPGLGYWAKVRAGKPVQQTPLPHSEKPAAKVGIRTGLAPQPQTTAELLSFLPPEDRSVVLSVAALILLPDEDAKMHPKVSVHRKKVIEWYKKSRKQDQYWSRRSKDAIPFLADTISEEALPRVCRIFDALIKAAEPLGCSLTDDLKFVVNGETVTISISESQDKVAHVPTREENLQLLKYEEEKRTHTWASKPNIRKYDYVYNGKIALSVNSEKSFRDCKSYVVEERLGDIFVQLYKASNALRIRREEREAVERKRIEAEQQRNARRKRYNLEVERTAALVNESEDFEIACKIRAYISAIEQKEALTEEDAVWIAWAKQKADWYDPTIKHKDEYFGVRDHGLDSSRKKLEKSYSSWG